MAMVGQNIAFHGEYVGPAISHLKLTHLSHCTASNALGKRTHSGHDLTFQIVKKAVQHLNRGQTPVITFDQPLFDLAKIDVMFPYLLNGVVGCRN